MNGAGDDGLGTVTTLTAGLVATAAAFAVTRGFVFVAVFFATTRFVAFFLALLRAADFAFFFRVSNARFFIFAFFFECFALLFNFFLAMIAS